MAIYTATVQQMSSSPLRSRAKCPRCGSALYYVSTFLTFFNGEKQRVCQAANCSYKDAQRFKFVSRYEPFKVDTTEGGPRDRTG